MFKKIIDRFKYKMMAKQLRKPGGSAGHKVGNLMNKANEFLYDFTAATMQLKDNDAVLEIGFGNGNFFTKLFSKANNLLLSGIDYSETMYNEAVSNNAGSIADGILNLQAGSSDELPFAANSFGKVFCINVIYFWNKPEDHLQEIYRVLKPGGRFYATIRSKASLELMPFTKFGFAKYTEEEWKDIINRSSLHFIKTERIDEPTVQFENKPFQVYSLCFIAEK